MAKIDLNSLQKLKHLLESLAAKTKDKIPGGLADGMPDSSFNQQDLNEGIKVEMEHTSDPQIADEIAKDHLKESPVYYKKLKEVELEKSAVKEYYWDELLKSQNYDLIKKQLIDLINNVVHQPEESFASILKDVSPEDTHQLMAEFYDPTMEFKSGPVFHTNNINSYKRALQSSPVIEWDDIKKNIPKYDANTYYEKFIDDNPLYKIHKILSKPEVTPSDLSDLDDEVRHATSGTKFTYGGDSYDYVIPEELLNKIIEVAPKIKSLDGSPALELSMLLANLTLNYKNLSSGAIVGGANQIAKLIKMHTDHNITLRRLSSVEDNIEDIFDSSQVEDLPQLSPLAEEIAKNPVMGIRPSILNRISKLPKLSEKAVSAILNNGSGRAVERILRAGGPRDFNVHPLSYHELKSVITNNSDAADEVRDYFDNNNENPEAMKMLNDFSHRLIKESGPKTGTSAQGELFPVEPTDVASQKDQVAIARFLDYTQKSLPKDDATHIIDTVVNEYPRLLMHGYLNEHINPEHLNLLQESSDYKNAASHTAFSSKVRALTNKDQFSPKHPDWEKIKQTALRNGDKETAAHMLSKDLLSNPNLMHDPVKFNEYLQHAKNLKAPEILNYIPNTHLSQGHISTLANDAVGNDDFYIWRNTYLNAASNPNALPQDIEKIYKAYENKEGSPPSAEKLSVNTPEHLINEWAEKYPHSRYANHAIILGSRPAKGDHVNVSFGTNKLRQARHLAEQLGGKISKKELEKQGMNLQALGINKLLDSQGFLHADEKLDKFIDSLPKTPFKVHDTQYGTDYYDAGAYKDAIEEAKEEYERDFEDNLSDHVSRRDYLDEDRARELHEDKFDNDIDEADYTDEDGNLNEYDYQEAVNNARDAHNDNFELDDWEDDPRVFDEDSYNEAVDRARDSHMEDFYERPHRYVNTKSKEEAMEEAGHEQRHNHQPSEVLQINFSPEHVQKIKQAGLMKEFREALDTNGSGIKESYRDDYERNHPKGPLSLGWTRYTKGEDGIHIDEIQSDFASGLNGDISDLNEKIKEAKYNLGMPGKENDPERLARLQELTEEHGKLSKIKEILFEGKHPGEIIHETFLQTMRDRGHDLGKQVHIWQAPNKAAIANQNEKTYVLDHQPEKRYLSLTQPDLYDDESDHSMQSSVKSAIDHWFKKNKIEVGNPNADHTANIAKINDAWAKTKDYVRYNDESKRPQEKEGQKLLEVPLPAHMNATYNQQPPKLGYTPAKYGELATQDNPEHEGEHTWKMKLVKSEELQKNDFNVRPKFAGDTHPTKPYVGKTHTNGNLVWHYNHPTASRYENDIKDHAYQFLQQHDPAHHPILKQFITNVLQDPARHAVVRFDDTGGQAGAKIRARHIRSLVIGHPSARILSISPNKIKFGVDRHGRDFQAGGPMDNDVWEINLGEKTPKSLKKSEPVLTIRPVFWKAPNGQLFISNPRLHPKKLDTPMELFKCLKRVNKQTAAIKATLAKSNALGEHIEDRKEDHENVKKKKAIGLDELRILLEEPNIKENDHLEIPYYIVYQDAASRGTH